MNAKESANRIYQANEYLFYEGEPAEAAFIIESGKVAIRTQLAGEEKTLSELGPGDILGEMAVIDNLTRTASAVCMETCQVKVIHRNQLVDRVQNADPIVRHLLDVTLYRYRHGLQKANNPDKKIPPLQTTGKPASSLDAIEKISLEVDLRHALESGALQAVYQPIQNIQTGQVAGFETLTRWCHAQHGYVNPEAFITLAEETDLIIPIGLQNMQQACRDLKKFQALLSHDHLFMSINISGKQLRDPDFASHVLAVIQNEDIEPSRIKLEITESLIMNFEEIQHWINASKKNGFQISLDDFGTGYAGLGQLCELNIDTLKIDKSFIQPMFSDQKRMVVLQSIISLGLGLDLSIIAEGVENTEHEAYLAKLGVKYGQGYLYAKPQDAETTLAWLKHRNA